MRSKRRCTLPVGRAASSAVGGLVLGGDSMATLPVGPERALAERGASACRSLRANPPAEVTGPGVIRQTGNSPHVLGCAAA